MPSWTNPISLRGLSVLAGDGPPSDDLGQFGSPGYIDLKNPDGPAFYGPKMLDGWPTDFVVLKGSDAKLPKDIVGNSLVISPVDGDTQAVQIALKNSAGNTVFASDAQGNVLVGGTFNVADVATISTLNAGNINVSDLAVSDDASFMGALEVAGSTTLQHLSAATAEVTGALSADTAQIGTLQTGSLTATGSLTTPNLNVTKLATLQDAAMATLTVGTPAKAGAATVNGPLQVSGQSTLDDVQAGDVRASSLDVTGPIAAAGALSAESLSLQLPDSGAPETPLRLQDAAGRNLFGVTRDGDASILGTLVVAGAQTSEATNAGALTSTSFVNSGLTRLQGTLDVEGASTLADVMAAGVTADSLHVTGALAVDGPSTLAGLQAADTTLASLACAGAIVGQSTLDIAGATTLRQLAASSVRAGTVQADGNSTVGGILSVAGDTALHALTASDAQLVSLTASGAARIAGTLGAGPSQLEALGIGAAPISGTPLAVTGSQGDSLLRLDDQGVLHVASGIVIDGADASSSTTLGALSVSSFYDQGSASIQGTLSVASDAMLQAVSATDLSVQTLQVAGASTLSGPVAAASLSVAAALDAGAVTTRGLSVAQDDNGRGGNLSVQGIASLGETRTADAHLDSLEVLGSSTLRGGLGVLGGASVALGLSVGGSTTLANLTAAASRLASLVVNGTAQIAGTLAAGATTVPALSIALPASGAAATPLSVATSDGVSLLALDGAGNLSIPGVLTVSGGAGGASSLGALTVTSLSDTGNAQIAGTLAVQGLSTLAQLKVTGSTILAGTTTGALSAASLTVSGTTVLAGLQASGNTTLAALSAAAISAASLTTTGAVSVGTALSVTGSTTLTALTAASLQVGSLGVSQDASIGGKLSVAGAATFTSTLGVSGAATFGSSINASGTLTVPVLAVSLPASGGSATPVTVQRADGTQLLSFDTNGNLTIAGTLSAAGGQSGSGSANLGDLTVTSLTDTGAASIGTTLSVTGASTLAALSATSIAASGPITAPSLQIALPATAAAAKPLNLTNSAGTSLLSADASGNLSIGGTLGVVGNTSLATLSATGAVSFGSTLSATGSVTFGSALSVTGNVSAAAHVATGVGSSSAPAFGYSSSGLYFESLYGQMSESVRGFRTRYLTYAAGRPQDYGANYLTHQFYTGVSSVGDAAYQFFYAVNRQALGIDGAGSVTIGNSTDGVGHVMRTATTNALTPIVSFFSGVQTASVAAITGSGGLRLTGAIQASAQTLTGALSVGGLTTSAGVTLSAGKLTFADGSSIATAPAASGPMASYSATAAGSAASPAFGYAGASAGAGAYFDANGNVLLSVNGYKSLYSTGSGGAAGASGWALASTLGGGSNLLALYGAASSASPVWAVDGAGTVSATSQTLTGSLSVGGATSVAALSASGLTKTAGLTLTSGALTFADGSSMTTAATGGGGGGGGGSGGAGTSAQNLSGNGPPDPALGNVGDVYYDLQNSLFYPPKTSAGWTASPINLVGPTGPSLQVQPLLGNLANAWGPASQLSAVNTTAGSFTYLNAPATTGVQQYSPLSNSSCTGLLCTNFGATGATITFALLDITDPSNAAVVLTGTVPNGTIQPYSYAAGTYPLLAGRTYVWGVYRNTTGSTTVNIVPVYTMPATIAGAGVGWYQNAVNLTQNTPYTLSNTSQFLGTPGLSGQQWYYRYNLASYIYCAQYFITGTPNTSVRLVFNNATANSNILVSPAIILPASGTASGNIGPFGVNTAYIPAGAQCGWAVIGTGTVSSINITTATAM